MSASRRLVLVAMLLLLAACGSGSSGVSNSAGTLLHAQVGAIRTAASHADRSAAAQQLVQLLTSVEQLKAKGELSNAAASRIRSAAAAVEGQLSLLPVPTTTTTTSPAENQRRKNHGHGKGNGDNQQGAD
jgi:hypothetical protein